ncbi:hypothetical protein ABTX81_14335 [Kitasatospora sp. NPDC097605]
MARPPCPACGGPTRPVNEELSAVIRRHLPGPDTDQAAGPVIF